MQSKKTRRVVRHPYAWLFLPALAALLLLAGCGGSTGSTSPTPTPTTPPSNPTPTPTVAATATSAGTTQMVMITTGSSGFAFSPTTLTVSVGTTVTWQNATGVSHTVTSDDGKTFDKLVSPGGKFSFTFTSAGTFAYHCSIHPYMKATITVK